ncbi:MAG TPA: O-antigen ligase family protein [Chthoniobacter sp.]|nr:O-antigen ligase family protein [Chthoniobacter sp.]
MNIDRFEHPNLKIPSAIGAGLGLAIALGMWAGSGDFDWLKRAAAAAILLVFVLFFLRFTWVVGLFICFSSFYQVGFGFTMGTMELSLALSGFFFAMTWWRKQRLDRPPILDNWSFGLLNTLILAWLAYVLAHTIFNIYDPYRPADYGLKNLLKTVEAWTGSALIIVYFGNRPQHVVVKKDFPQRIAWCFFAALSINIVIQLFNVLSGKHEAQVDPDDPVSGNYFTIPVLNLMENIYALREVPPLAMLFCGAMIVTRWFKERTLKQRRLFYIVMAESIFGAILSGGRGTLGFVLVLLIIFLFIQRRIGALIGLATVIVVLGGIVNLVPDQLKSAPPMVRRALNWALIEKDADVSEGINGSSNWRYALFLRALDEWRSDPRIYWFGRATYAYNLDDVIALTIDQEEASLQSALRRGATHNMITDLLVTFGLCGLVLFFALYFVLLYFLWTIYRAPQLDELARTFTLFMLISLIFNFAYGLLGGGNIPIAQAWFMMILVAYLYDLHRNEQQSQANLKIEPPKGPRFAPGRPGGALPART